MKEYLTSVWWRAPDGLDIEGVMHFWDVTTCADALAQFVEGCPEGVPFAARTLRKLPSDYYPETVEIWEAELDLEGPRD